MDPAQWTPTEAAYLLSEAYASSLGEDGADPNFTTLLTLTLALSADPKYMAGVWSAWCAEMEADGWTEKQVREAKRWLSMVAINELVSS